MTMRKEKIRGYVENFSYLSILRLIQILAPLLTYPYLIKVLGAEQYGVVILSTVIVGYFAILIDFGFDLSATKSISQNQEDIQKKSEIFSCVVILKFAFFTLSGLIMLFLILSIESLAKESHLYTITFFGLLYQVFFPTWFFSGIEKMKFITYIQVAVKVILIVLIFLVIHDPKDYILLAYITTLANILACVAGILVVNKMGVKFSFQNLENLKFYLSDSSAIFLSNISIKLYTTIGKISVSYFIGTKELTYYDFSEKILRLAKTPQIVLNQVLFPSSSRDRDIGQIKKFLRISLLVHSLVIIAALVFTPLLIEMFFDVDFLLALPVVNVMIFSVIIVIFSNFYGLHILIPAGHTSKFTNSVVVAILVYGIGLCILWSYGEIKLITVALLSVIADVIPAVYLWIIVRRLGLFKRI